MMKNYYRPVWIMAFSISFCPILTWPAFGQKEKNNAPKPDNKAIADETKIKNWIQQLDNPLPAKREEAQNKLLIAGKAAIDELAKAALSDKKDLSEKSIGIMNQLAESDDKPTREAALGALRKLAKSNRPLVAARAKRALDETDPDAPNPNGGNANPFGRANQVGDQTSNTVSVSNFNGRRLINVKKGDIETIIQDLDGGKILVRVKNGEKKTELKVNNLADLKAKHPEAHSLYLQYATNPKFPGGPGNGIPQWNNNGPEKNVNDLMIKKLEQMKEQFKDNQAMQQMINEQLRLLKK